MQRIRRSWWIVFGLVTLTWGVVEREALFAGDSVPVRALLLQYSGLLAMAWMSAAMILATRPQRFERWFGGLDKMYRLHKWVGISGFALSVAHWLIVNAPNRSGAGPSPHSWCSPSCRLSRAFRTGSSTQRIAGWLRAISPCCCTRSS